MKSCPQWILTRAVLRLCSRVSSDLTCACLFLGILLCGFFLWLQFFVGGQNARKINFPIS